MPTDRHLQCSSNELGSDIAKMVKTGEEEAAKNLLDACIPSRATDMVLQSKMALQTKNADADNKEDDDLDAAPMVNSIWAAASITGCVRQDVTDQVTKVLSQIGFTGDFQSAITKLSPADELQCNPEQSDNHMRLKSILAGQRR